MVAEGEAAPHGDRSTCWCRRAHPARASRWSFLVSADALRAVSGVRGLVSTATRWRCSMNPRQDAPVAVDAVASATSVRLRSAVLKGRRTTPAPAQAGRRAPHGGHPCSKTGTWAGPTERARQEILRIRSSGSPRPRRVTAMIWFPAWPDHAWHHPRRSPKPVPKPNTPPARREVSRRPRWKPPGRPTCLNHMLSLMMFGIQHVRGGDFHADAVVIDETPHELATTPTCAPRQHADLTVLGRVNRGESVDRLSETWTSPWGGLGSDGAPAEGSWRYRRALVDTDGRAGRLRPGVPVTSVPIPRRANPPRSCWPARPSTS